MTITRHQTAAGSSLTASIGSPANGLAIDGNGVITLALGSDSTPGAISNDYQIIGGSKVFSGSVDISSSLNLGQILIFDNNSVLDVGAALVTGDGITSNWGNITSTFGNIHALIGNVGAGGNITASGNITSDGQLTVGADLNCSNSYASMRAIEVGEYVNSHFVTVSENLESVVKTVLSGSTFVSGSIHITGSMRITGPIVSTGTSNVVSSASDGPTAVAHILDTATAWDPGMGSAGSRLLSIRTGGVERAYFSGSGGLVILRPAGSSASLIIPPDTWIESAFPPYGVGRLSFDGFKWVCAASEGWYINGLSVGTGGTTIAATSQLNLQGTGADTATGFGVTVRQQTVLTKPSGKLMVWHNAATNIAEVLAIQKDGKLMTADVIDSTATPGAATINRPSGRSAIALGASSVVITNATVTTGSMIQVTPLDLDATLTSYKAVPASASFTVTGNATATAAWKFQWLVLD